MLAVKAGVVLFLVFRIVTILDMSVSFFLKFDLIS